ncbi:hypothetical protein ACFQL9_13475 [Halobaculum lipolyticum]|uniref:Uncharacterized protein n=1 Tax=Halobaculum lipolyticum TaxID=3032001 RepID=A0ABD5WIQ8_9EURY
MGTDLVIAALDIEEVSPEAVRRVTFTTKGMEHLLGESAPLELTTGYEKVASLNEMYEGLEPSPAISQIDFLKLVTVARSAPLTRAAIDYYVSYRRAGATFLMGILPKFLDEVSPDAHRLWGQLLGSKRHLDREWFPFSLDGTTYRLSAADSNGGCLQGEDIAKLADELESIQPAFESFYDDLDERYRTSDAVRKNAIQTLCGICRHLRTHADSEQALVSYHF